MSDVNLARRTRAEVFFNGVDISESLQKYLLSITYTDNEEDEADDLQIQIEDRDGVWLCQWLNVAIQAAASPPTSSSAYTVTAKSGLRVRSGPGTNYKKLGLLAYGAQINVSSVKNGWAVISYSGKTAYVSTKYITAASSNANAGNWAIGDAVIANGRPQYTSYGDGTPGANVTNYKGSISRLNLKSGVAYPICVGRLGWFSEGQIKKAGVAGVNATNGASVKGMLIQATFIKENWNGDGKDTMLDCGQFELDGVDASGPPATITIKGTSLKYTSQIRQTKNSRAWESCKLSEIAKEMAARNKMACLYESKNDPVYKRKEQNKTSDIQFLQRLCHDAGISLKVTNNMLVLFDQASYEAQPPIFSVVRGSGGYTKYKLSTGEADVQYQSCRVSYVNPANGLSIEATAYVDDYDAKNENNQCLEISAKVNSIAEAKELAKKQLRLHNKYEKTANFTMQGNTEIVAGVTGMLVGWGLWDGKYIVKQAKHSVGSSGYTVQINLRHVLEGY